DHEERLKGVATLRHILQAKDETPLGEVMDADPHYLTADTSDEEVALLMTRYNILAVPVLDEETSRLLGVVTIYDMLDQLLPHADT
ncbi:MAG: CBS domain-containing protein, partial [Candidatus Xenobia bacterium]